jgi:polyisoprenoid-binding protein YceI
MIALTVPALADSTAQSGVPGAADISRVAAGSYAADPPHTLVLWRVNHFGFSNYYGLFGNIGGTLDLDPKNPAAAKLSVTIPVAEITTANAGLTEHLFKPGKDGAAPDFFGPNPAAAQFVSTAIKLDEEGKEALITGNLTLNGITRPVTIEAEFVGAGNNPMSKALTIGFEGEARIKRSDFGINAFVPLVSDEVELKIEAAFEKK